MDRPTLTARAYTGASLFVFVVTLAIVGAALTTWGGWYFYKDRMISGDGIAVEGVVVEQQTETTPNRGTGEQTSHALLVRYTDRAGNTHEQSFGVTSEQFRDLPEGSTIALRYSAADPGTAALQIAGLGERARYAGALGIAALLAALGCFVALSREVASQRRALRDGERVSARVTGLETLGRGKSVEHRLRFVTDAGVTGRSRGHAAQALPGVGAQIAVYLDPRGKRAWWEGDY